MTLKVKSLINVLTNFLRLYNNYKSDFKSFKIVIISLLFLFLNAIKTEAATYYSITSGNWNSNTTWSTTSGGTAVGAGVFPVTGDVVNIERGCTVTITANAACTTLSFTNATNSSSTLTISGTNSLSVSGTFTMIRPAAGYIHTVNYTK